MSTPKKNSVFIRFIAGPLGFAAAVGLMIGFTQIFTKTDLAQQIGNIFGFVLKWGILGIIVIIVGALILLFSFGGLRMLYWRFRELIENRSLTRNDIQYLRDTLSGGDPLLRRAALRSLSKAVPDKRVMVEDIAVFLHDDDEKLAVHCADLLGRLKHNARKAIPYLIEAIEKDKHQSFKFRSNVIMSIERIGFNRAERNKLSGLKGKVHGWKKDGTSCSAIFDQAIGQKPYD